LIVGLFFSFGNACSVAFQQLVGHLNDLFTVNVGYCASIHTSGFYRDYKTHRWVSWSPTCSFVIVVLKVLLYLCSALLIFIAFCSDC
jgi:hypothetical protein